jgi:uncharacterized protein (TIGR02391 family)
MKEKYVMISRLIRNILLKCHDMSDSGTQMLVGDENVKILTIPYIQQDLNEILRLWPADCNNSAIVNTIHYLKDNKFELYDFMKMVIEIGNTIDNYYEDIQLGDTKNMLLELLHPIIIESSFMLFSDGNYREAVLNGIICLFDLIRRRTNLDKDGLDLVNEVFSLQNPILKLSDLATDTEKNIQKGFLLMMQGLYTGVRNPKAHSLNISIDKRLAAQYLAFISLLTYKVEAAKNVS